MKEIKSARLLPAPTGGVRATVKIRCILPISSLSLFSGMEPIKPPSQQRRSPLPHSKTSRISITKTRAAAFLPRIRLSRKALPVLPFLSGVRSLPVRFFGNAAAASSKTWITPGSCNSSSAGWKDC